MQLFHGRIVLNPFCGRIVKFRQSGRYLILKPLLVVRVLLSCFFGILRTHGNFLCLELQFYAPMPLPA